MLSHKNLHELCRRLAILVSIGAVVMSFACSSASGQDRTFNGSASIFWSNAANWTPSDVPDTAVENAVIDGGGAFTVRMNGTFTIGDLTIGSDDQLDQDNAQDLTLAGSSVINNGLYRLMDVGSLTDLVIGSSEITFSGGGELFLNGSGNNRIYGSTASNMLVNSPGHTISGGGQLGAGGLSLTNGGLISATVSTLTVNPGTGTVINNATMQADGGVLLLQNGTFQNNSVIRSLDGSEVRLSGGASLVGGNLTKDGNAASLTRVVGDSVSFTNVTNQSRLVINNSYDPVFAGTFTNNGQVEQNDVGSLTDIQVNGSVNLDGTGVWTMRDSGNNRWSGLNGPSDALTNGASHTIQGAGQLGVDGLGIINNGVVEAHLASASRLTIDPSDADVDGSGTDFWNKNLLRARNDGFLRLQGGVFRNETGMIRAIEAAEVELNSGATIVGGTFSTDANPDSRIRIVGNDVTIQDVTNQGRMRINNAIDPILGGTFANNGTVFQNDVGSLTDVRLSGDVTLSGNGTWTMSNSFNNRWHGLDSSTEVLTNGPNHTIEGAGQLGFGAMGFVNNGRIDANVGTLQIDPSDVDLGGGADVQNNGMLQASNGAALNLAGGLFENNNTIQALDGSVVNLVAGAHVRGGDLATSGSGVISISDNTAILEDVRLTTASKMRINNAFDPVLVGTITNNGQVSQNDVGSLTDVRLSGNVTLTGNGRWTMTSSGNNRWYGLTTGQEILTNASAHTIEGGGQIGSNSMGLVNNGLVDANSGTLTIDPSDGDLGGGEDVVNNDTLQASGGGTLTLRDGLFRNNDTIRALAGSTANLATGSHIRGGRLTTVGTGVIVLNEGTATMENVQITSGSTLRINNAVDPVLIGTITNNGQVNQNDVGSLTDVRLSGDVTLTGNGTWSMSSSGNNRWYGLDTGDEMLTNSRNHTIDGAGQFGANSMRVLNQGLIDGNRGTLTLDPSDGGTGVATFINEGTLRASAGRTVNLTASGGGEFSNTGIIEALDGSTVASDAVMQQISTQTVEAGTYRAINGVLNIATASYQPATNNGVIEALGATANNDVLGVKSGNDHLNENLSLNNGTILLGGGANLVLTNPPTDGIANPLLVSTTGEIVVGGGSRLDVTSRSTVFNVPSDTTVAGLHVDGGTLRGSGTIDGGVYMPAGRLSPGDAAGQTGLLSIVGDFNMDDPDLLIENAITLIELGGYTRGTQYDSFDATGDFFGQGELRGSLVNGFLPNIGDEFVVATYVEDGNVIGNLWDNYSFNRVQFSLVDRSLGGQARETVMTVLDIRDIDFNGDLAFDCADVDALVSDIVAGTNTPMFDLNFDGAVDADDLNVWLTDAGALNLASGQAYLYGDANLDGIVDVSDFNIWNVNKFTASPAWCSGDFNADGFVDTSDFNVWNNNKFTSSGIITLATVPEPSLGWLWIVTATGLLLSRGRRRW